MRVAILWTRLSGYLNACLKELASRKGVELFLSYQEPEEQAPFGDDQFSWLSNPLKWRSQTDLSRLRARLNAFDPEIIVFSGWHIPAYRRAAKESIKRCWRVMVMDNCWMATPKQRIGALIAPWYILPLADAVWVPGERQAAFARRFGFEERDILWGMLSCDRSALETVYLARLADRRPVPHSFLFVGRFVAEKGIDLLVRAYDFYRETSVDPWPLVCCGAGPLADRLQGKAGICVEGFVQPDLLRDKLADAGCLILPSSFEPWAVVVHEAASAGLLILASEQVGASVHLVQNHFNGYLISSKDAKGLAARMSHIANMSEARLDAMSRASNLLSKQYSPERWADTLLESFYTRPINMQKI